MLERFASGADRSMNLAGRLEVALDEAFPEDETVQELVLALASYGPGGRVFFLRDAAEVAPMCQHMLTYLGFTPST
jgi:hypothetical protein